jgi:hypothetical protein
MSKRYEARMKRTWAVWDKERKSAITWNPAG